MRYKCSVCGYTYEGDTLPDNYVCPICHQTGKFEPEPDQNTETAQSSSAEKPLDLSYDPLFARQDSSCRYMKEIHEMAVSGTSLHSAMGTQLQIRLSRSSRQIPARAAIPRTRNRVWNTICTAPSMEKPHTIKNTQNRTPKPP